MAGRSTKSWQERLWAKVDKSGDCWLWTGSLQDGYGQLNIAGKPERANRLVCQIYHGPAPEGLHALHSCDVRACCNPAHLSWGTRSRNMRECRDRSKVGGKQKLTAEQANVIRQSPARTNDLARQFGVSRWQIANIRGGKQWSSSCSTP